LYFVLQRNKRNSLEQTKMPCSRFPFFVVPFHPNAAVEYTRTGEKKGVIKKSSVKTKVSFVLLLCRDVVPCRAPDSKTQVGRKFAVCRGKEISSRPAPMRAQVNHQVRTEGVNGDESVRKGSSELSVFFPDFPIFYFLFGFSR
jgi:hypothetical protein